MPSRLERVQARMAETSTDLLVVGLIALLFWGTDTLMQVFDRRF